MAVAAVMSSYRRAPSMLRDTILATRSGSLAGVERDSDIVTINIGGKIFQTYEHTLNRFPNTLLGSPEKRVKYFDLHRKQYFFDRHRGSFTAILYYYQSSGLLERPLDIPTEVFMAEVNFFQLNDTLQRKNGEMAALQNKPSYEDTVAIGIEDAEIPRNALAKRIYLLFEQPSSSVQAKCLAIFSLSVILLSIIVFCVETLPELRNPEKLAIFFSLNASCSTWFTIEYLVRLLVSTSKLKFLRGFLNILDLLSILPFYVTLIVHDEAGGIAVLRVMRVIRVCRIFKLTRHSKGLHILGKTLVSSLNELCMLTLFLVIGVIVFASAAYYAEEEGNEGFASIPHAFWWAVITMTTVGYGDITPKTFVGELQFVVVVVVFHDYIDVCDDVVLVDVDVDNYNYNDIIGQRLSFG